MGFLDSAGLARLWGKVKAQRRVLTAAEYAVLSEEERNADVVYMVPEEGGGGASGGIPSGCILIWSGAADAVPDGWRICDGTEGTPDLRGRFVLGQSGSHTAGETGGAEEVTLTANEMPNHRHPQRLPTNVGTNAEFFRPRAYMTGGGTSGMTIKNDAIELIETFSFAVAVWTDYQGGSQPHNNMPPYYALCYIMKL